MRIVTRRSALLVAVLSLTAACSSGSAEKQAAPPPSPNIVQGEPQNAAGCVTLINGDVCAPVGGAAENKLDRVLVMPMIEVIGEPVYPPDPDLDLPVDTADPDVGFEVTVTGTTQDQIHSQIQLAYDTWLTSSMGKGVIEGNCGYSYAILVATKDGDHDAYHNGGFRINRPGYGYRLNIRTWDPDINTFNLNTPKTGNLFGTRAQEVFGFFHVPQTDTYRTKLTRGDVYVGGNSWCVTGQPQTTEYLRR